MATATRICKVCGKEYEYCHTFRRGDMFRWQDVACCPEHGNTYFERVLRSRNQQFVKDNQVNSGPNAGVTVDVSDTNAYEDLYDDEEDELFEADFEDDDFL